MLLARVVGPVWGTRHAEGLDGRKVLELRTPQGGRLCAVDALGAGPGEWVLVKLTPRSKKLGVAQVIANVPPHDVVCVMAYESNPERFLFLAVEIGRASCRERVSSPV